MLESLLESGIPEPEADPAQSDVREHGVGLEVVGQDPTEHESGCCPRGGSRNKRGRPRVPRHVASVEWERAGDHRQRPHRTLYDARTGAAVK